MIAGGPGRFGHRPLPRAGARDWRRAEVRLRHAPAREPQRRRPAPDLAGGAQRHAGVDAARPPAAQVRRSGRGDAGGRRAPSLLAARRGSAAGHHRQPRGPDPGRGRARRRHRVRPPGVRDLQGAAQRRLPGRPGLQLPQSRPGHRGAGAGPVRCRSAGGAGAPGGRRAGADVGLHAGSDLDRSADPPAVPAVHPPRGHPPGGVRPVPAVVHRGPDPGYVARRGPQGPERADARADARRARGCP